MNSNTITVEGDYKFEIGTPVMYMDERYVILHRYTERLAKNKVAAIARYVIWDPETNHLNTVSEIVLAQAD